MVFYLKAFDTQVRAEQWARSFDYARAWNALPPLTICRDAGDARWWATNEHPEVKPLPGCPPELRRQRVPMQVPRRVPWPKATAEDAL